MKKDPSSSYMNIGLEPNITQASKIKDDEAIYEEIDLTSDSEEWIHVIPGPSNENVQETQKTSKGHRGPPPLPPRRITDSSHGPCELPRPQLGGDVFGIPVAPPTPPTRKLQSAWLIQP